MVVISPFSTQLLGNLGNILTLTLLAYFLLRGFMALLVTRRFTELSNGNSLRRRSESMYLVGTSGHV